MLCLLFTMNPILERRTVQLNKQRSIDDRLSKCPCPEIVSKYLLERREVNRTQTELVEKGGFLNMWKNTHKNLDDIDNHQVFMEDLLKDDTGICTELSKYLKIH